MALAAADATSAFSLAPPDASVPASLAPSPIDPRVLLGSCLTSAPFGLLEGVAALDGVVQLLDAPYPLPVPPQAQPGQEPGRTSRSSGSVSCP